MIKREPATKVVRVNFLLLLILLATTGQAAGDFRPAGGRASGLSGISVAVSDHWSGANNQAGNAWNNGIFCGVFFENRYMVKELSYKALLFSACTRSGVFSVTCMHFGTSIYSELKSGVGYARKFGKHLSAGIQLNYYRFHVCYDYGSRNLFNCEVGLQYRPGKQITVGFDCINPVPVKVSEISGESLPTLIQFGLTYYFTEELMVSAEIEKDPVSKVRARMGSEYRFGKVLSARAGIATGPFQLSIGAGIAISSFSVDFASEYNQVLGFSPSVSLQYQFKK